MDASIGELVIVRAWKWDGHTLMRNAELSYLDAVDKGLPSPDYSISTAGGPMPAVPCG